MEKIITTAISRGARDRQEDFNFSMSIHSSNFKGWLIAIADGHNGKEVAKLCSERISAIFKMNRAHHAKSALKELVDQFHEEAKNFYEGATLSIALIIEEPEKTFDASIAILGDSPMIVLDESGKMHVSTEHNVRSDMEERKAIDERALQLSRTLGNADLKTAPSRQPEIYTIPDPRWVLVASDKLLDPSHGNTAGLINELKGYALRAASANNLMAWAEKRGLMDNGTAIVWG